MYIFRGCKTGPVFSTCFSSRAGAEGKENEGEFSEAKIYFFEETLMVHLTRVRETMSILPVIYSKVAEL